MRWVAAILLLGSTAQASTDEGGNIVGGTRTQVGEHPSVVAVRVGQSLCTGTLIHPEWVVTAAHCVSPGSVGGTQEQITAATRVQFDTVDINASNGTVIDAVVTIPRLPNWNDANIGSNDIGLIKLERPVFSIAPSLVNLELARAPVGIEVLMIGYGRSGVGPSGSLGVELQLANRMSITCGTFGFSDVALLCFDQTDNKGKCEGDSGGPSFATLDGVETLVGITSFGDETCSQFGADTRTDAEAAFLLEHIPWLEGCVTAADCGAANICLDGQCAAEPLTPGGLGEACGGPADCVDGLCAAFEEGNLCTVACSVKLEETCPSGFTCVGDATAAFCAPGEDGGGCCDAGNGGPTALFGMAFVGLVLRRRRAE